MFLLVKFIFEIGEFVLFADEYGPVIYRLKHTCRKITQIYNNMYSETVLIYTLSSISDVK